MPPRIASAPPAGRGAKSPALSSALAGDKVVPDPAGFGASAAAAPFLSEDCGGTIGERGLAALTIGPSSGAPLPLGLPRAERIALGAPLSGMFVLSGVTAAAAFGGGSPKAGPRTPAYPMPATPLADITASTASSGGGLRLTSVSATTSAMRCPPMKSRGMSSRTRSHTSEVSK